MQFKYNLKILKIHVEKVNETFFISVLSVKTKKNNISSPKFSLEKPDESIQTFYINTLTIYVKMYF